MYFRTVNIRLIIHVGLTDDIDMFTAKESSSEHPEFLAVDASSDESDFDLVSFYL